MSFRDQLNAAGLAMVQGDHSSPQSILRGILADPAIEVSPVEKFEALALLTDCYGETGQKAEALRTLRQARAIPLEGIDYLRMGHHLQVLTFYEQWLVGLDATRGLQTTPPGTSR